MAFVEGGAFGGLGEGGVGTSEGHGVGDMECGGAGMGGTGQVVRRL